MAEQVVEHGPFGVGHFEAYAQEVDELVRIAVFQKPDVLNGFTGIGFVSAGAVGILELGGNLNEDVFGMEEAADILSIDFLLSVVCKEILEGVVDEVGLFEVFEAADGAL